MGAVNALAEAEFSHTVQIEGSSQPSQAQDSLGPVIKELKDDIMALEKSQIETAALNDLRQEAEETVDGDLKTSLKKVSQWFFSMPDEEREAVDEMVHSNGWLEGLSLD